MSIETQGSALQVELDSARRRIAGLELQLKELEGHEIDGFANWAAVHISAPSRHVVLGVLVEYRAKHDV